MARSKFLWLLVFDDTTTKVVKAQTISQMMYCEQIDMDSVISITRIELLSCGNDYPNAIDIEFQN